MSYKMQPLDDAGITPFMQVIHLEREVRAKIADLEHELREMATLPSKREQPLPGQYVKGGALDALRDVLAVLDGKPGSH